MKNIDKKLIDWFRLYSTKSIGPVTFKKLIAKFKTATDALAALPEVSHKFGRLSGFEIPSEESAMKYFEKCAKKNVDVIPFYDASYPKSLKLVDSAPMLLHVSGRKELLNKPIIAVVGSRDASLQGIAFAQKITKDLAQAGFVIVSGLARGIDTAAHTVALQTGTIGVLGSGIDVVYPAENKDLQERVAKDGLLVTESFLGKEPRAQTFSYRNRIISGLSLGVLVVEAAPKSGTLITAEYATAQNKDVFAVPGHPYDPRAKGTNFLIKQGAYLVENAYNIIDHYKNLEAKMEYQQKLFEANQVNEDHEKYFANDDDIFSNRVDDEIKQFLQANLSGSFMSVNDIVAQSGYSSAQIQSALSQLELAGVVEFEFNMVRKVVMV